MKSLVEARHRRARAVELALEGQTFDAIARAVGYTHRASAHRAVAKALQEREIPAVDQYRQLQLDRLDALQAALWDRCSDGDLDAVSQVIRLMDQRNRLLGLYTTGHEFCQPLTLVRK